MEDHGFVQVEVEEAGAGAGQDRCAEHRAALRHVPGLHPGLEQQPRDVEHQQVHPRPGQGGQEIEQDEFVDADGVPHGSEVALAVVVLIDGLDGHFPEAHPHPLHVQQHIGLVLKAVSPDLQQGGEEGRRNAPKPGLGVAQADAADQAEDAAGDAVAAAGAGGHLGAGEVPAAHDDALVVSHRLRHGQDVRDSVLAVPVDGDGPPAVRAVFQQKGESRAQGLTFPSVDRVGQHRHLAVARCMAEVALAVLPTAVVHDDDVGEAGGHGLVHHGVELVGGVQGGEDQADALRGCCGHRGDLLSAGKNSGRR